MPSIAFSGTKRIASGDLAEVMPHVKAALEADKWTQVLIFDAETSEPVDFDFRAQPERPEETKRPGRPRLGVVAREVTLLPRHWDWLATQPGGASVALRKLVDHARTANREKDRRRLAQESAYRFMSAIAGNEPGFEEATRALFAGNRDRFHAEIDAWPADIRDHAKTLATASFDNPL